MSQTERTVFLVASALVLIGYSTTLSVAHNLWLRDAIPAGVANALPTILFGAGAYWLVANLIAGRPPAVQAGAHMVVGGAYALLAYWLLIVMLGLVNAASPTQFEVRPLISRAMAWQLLQNVTTYGVIALLAYQRRPKRDAPSTAIESGPRARDPMSRYFVRNGDEILPVDVDAIVTITGADDYAEVKTETGRHLARITLAKFEQALDSTRFVRIHRSRIVNLQRIDSVEPAGGGRLLLHMNDGEEIVTSRVGANALRERFL